MEASALHEPTRKIRLPKIRRDVADLCGDDPVVIHLMGILETEAVRFGADQRHRLDAGEREMEIRISIGVHIGMADAGNNLSTKQAEYLTQICFDAAGLKRSSVKLD